MIAKVHSANNKMGCGYPTIISSLWSRATARYAEAYLTAP